MGVVSDLVFFLRKKPRKTKAQKKKGSWRHCFPTLLPACACSQGVFGLCFARSETSHRRNVVGLVTLVGALACTHAEEEGRLAIGR